MNRRSAFPLVLFLGVASIPAASFGLSHSQSTTLQGVPESTDCPIDMRVQFQSPYGAARPVDKAHADENGLQLHIDLGNLKSVAIVGADVTVHGFTTKGRVSPARVSQADASDITKDIYLHFKVNGKTNASADIQLDGFGAVRYVELNSVHYADGSTWRSSAQRTCHVAPDAAMLISSR